MSHPENRQRPNEDISVVEWLAHSLPKDKYSVTRERLSELSTLQLEQIKCPEIGMGAVVARVGRRYTKKELDKEIGAKFGPEFVVGETGFREIWRVPPEYTFENIYWEEMLVIQTLAATVLKLNKWKPEEVEVLYFAGSPILPQPPIIPPHYDTDEIKKAILLNYGDVIARITGLDHLIGKKKTFCCFGACNAGGHAVKDILTNPELKGKKVLLIAYEGLTKQLPEFDQAKADHLSHYFFSDGGVALGVISDETLTYLVGESGTVEDREGLKVLEPWRFLIDDREGPLVQRKGNTTFVRLAQPPGGMVLLLEGGTTTKLILRSVSPPAKRVNEVHERLYPERMKFRFPHVASTGVVEGLERRVGQLDCRVDDGNSSGATTLINFLRHLPSLKRGDHVMLLSFGAGLFWDISAVRVGPREKDDIPVEIRTGIGPVVVYDRRAEQAQAA